MARNWTVMVYFSAGSNIREQAIADLMEMKQAGSSREVAILAQVDLLGGETARYYLRRSPDYLLAEDKNYGLSSSEAVTLKDKPIGDPQTLLNFVQWCKDKYEAANYMLVVWGHGQGVSTTPMSKTNPTSCVDPFVVKQIGKILETNGKLDILGLDACLMGTTEVAYEYRDCVRYFISSEDVVPAEGWPYHTILAKLVSQCRDGDVDAQCLVKDIVAKYVRHYQLQKRYVTLSACNLQHAQRLFDAMYKLVSALSAYNWKSGYLGNALGDDDKFLDSTFAPEESQFLDWQFIDASALKAKLDALAPDAVSAHLKGTLGVTATDVPTMIGELNNLIRTGAAIFDAVAFSGVQLSKHTENLLLATTTPTEKARLNRFLLDDAYPREVISLKESKRMMRIDMEGNHYLVMKARVKAQSYYAEDLVDLYDFCRNLSGIYSEIMTLPDKIKPGRAEKIVQCCFDIIEVISGERPTLDMTKGLGEKIVRHPESVSEERLVEAFGYYGYPLRNSHGVTIYFPSNTTGDTTGSLTKEGHIPWLNYFGLHQLSERNIIDGARLLDKLKNSTDGVSAYLRGKMSVLPDTTLETVIAKLNTLIANVAFQDKFHKPPAQLAFQAVTSEKTKELLAKEPLPPHVFSYIDMTAINLRLLIDAYPEEIADFMILSFPLGQFDAVPNGGTNWSRYLGYGLLTSDFPIWQTPETQLPEDPTTKILPNGQQEGPRGFDERYFVPAQCLDDNTCS